MKALILTSTEWSAIACALIAFMALPSVRR